MHMVGGAELKQLYKVFESDKEDLSAHERLVLVLIHTYSKNAPVDFSYEEIARYTGLSRKGAYNVVKSLLGKDLLRVEKTEGKSNAYRLNF